ncbi:MAG: hypothetical protein R3F14_27330 [Polyangiaceae bacterium]
MEPTKAQVDSALEGDEAAVRALVATLTPVLHARVTRALLRRGGVHAGSQAREQIADMVQDVFVELFRDEGRALRAWDPERGMSLRNWVGFLAEQRVAAVRRGKRHTLVLQEVLSDDAGAEEAPPRDDPEALYCSRQTLSRLLDALRADLSPQGFEMFEALVIREEAISQVCERTGFSTSAVQAWSSRLKRKAAQILSELSGPALAQEHVA